MPKVATQYRKCRQCNARFKVTRKWHIFCKASCKLKWNKNNALLCFYCGGLATCKDHVYPVKLEGKRKTDEELVNACTECNALLKANYFPNLFDRLNFLRKKYIGNYGLDQEEVLWKDNELEELGIALKSRIKRSINEKRAAEEKVSYIMHVMYVIDKGTTYRKMSQKDVSKLIEEDVQIVKGAVNPYSPHWKLSGQ